jgi:N-methylhydantoinase A
VLTLDIGGTSADVSLILDGKPQFGTGELIGDFPVNVPSVAVTSIGDGGGSIASVDSYGVLKVGPESAGSLPGPACYGRGGTRATITDALVALGYLGHAPLAYSSIALDKEAARRAIEPLAKALGRGLEDTAQAMLDVAISGMFMEVNKLIARHGVDVRDFTLFPFGGAGPMLGAMLARELGIARVLVPPRPGVTSALGGLIADVKSDFIATILAPLERTSRPQLKEAAERLAHEGRDWLYRQQRFIGSSTLAYMADMR